MNDLSRPRRFFGLLCAHQWEMLGTRERSWESGRTESKLMLRCAHCGDTKVGS